MLLRDYPSHKSVALSRDALNEARTSLEVSGFAIIRDVLDPSLVTHLTCEAKAYFFEVSKQSSLSQALRGNVGAGMSNIEGYSRNNSWYLYRSCVFPWNRVKPELSALVDISRYLSGIRNILVGLPFDHGSCLESDGTIAYTSLSLYPAGGGFLSKHKDGHKSDQLIHFKVELSQKGLDYTQGGFFLWDKEGREIDISSKSRPSDLVFFDGSLEHEIKPIYGTGVGRIAIFEIPTYVNPDSLRWSYQQSRLRLIAIRLAKMILRSFRR
jgi:hypothetical protein